MNNGATFTADWLAEALQGRIRQDGVPQNRQIYRALREMILAGQLTADCRLPSSRALAQELAIARNTVLFAYEQLLAEGYLQTRHGSGSYVSAVLPAARRPEPKPAAPATGGVSRRASQWLAALATRGERAPRSGHAFVPGRPDIQAFPLAVWQRLLARHWRQTNPAELDYLSAGGHSALKRALADYLKLARSVDVAAEQIVVTSGTQQSLDLLARLLADAGDWAWVEEPGYPGAVAAFQANGLRLQAMPVDDEGLNWQASPGPSPRLIYITPSHQYPTGSVMSLARRLALLEYAAETGAWIIEDDYDSEFRYGGRPLAALQGLDRNGQVAYLGTCSKMMFPGLRIGYMVLPLSLVEPARRMLARLYRETAYPQQLALADFIADGHLAMHIKRMRACYAQRQQLLRDHWQAELGDAVPLTGGDTGIHLLAPLPAACDDRAISLAVLAKDIIAPPLSEYCLSPEKQRGLVLGYAAVREEEMAPAVQHLAHCLTSFI